MSRDGDHVLPLGGKAVILGHGRPAIGKDFDVALSKVKHRLNREDHAFFESQPRAGGAVMEHLRIFMKVTSNPVTAKFLNHGESIVFGVALDGVPDIAKSGSGFYFQDAEIHRLLTQFHEACGANWYVTHREHFAGVPMVTVLDDGDVDVDDVTALEFLGSGDAMANRVVDRCADGFREASVIERGRNGALSVHNVIVTNAVQFFRRDSRDHIRFDHLEDFGRKLPRNPEFFDLFWRF